MYGIYEPQKGEKQIVRLSDTAFISMDEANPDYRAYLAWIAEGNTAEPWNDTPTEITLEERTDN